MLLKSDRKPHCRASRGDTITVLFDVHVFVGTCISVMRENICRYIEQNNSKGNNHGNNQAYKRLF